MPPEGDDAYGRPYGDPYGNAYGDPYGERDDDEPYSPRGSGGSWPYGAHGEYAQGAEYGQGEDFQRAVDALQDPLSDPLPGQSAGRQDAGRQSAAPGAGPNERAASGSYEQQGTYGQQRGRQGYEPGYGQPQAYGGQAYDGQGFAGQGYGAQGQPTREPSSPGYGTQGYEAQGYDAQGYAGPGQQSPQQAAGYPARDFPVQESTGRGYSSQGYEPETYEGTGPQGQQDQDGGLSPWFRPHRGPGAEPPSGTAPGADFGTGSGTGAGGAVPGARGRQPGGSAGSGGRHGSGQGASASPPQEYGGARQVPYGGGQSGARAGGQAGARSEGPQQWQAAAGTAAGPPVTGQLRTPSNWNRAAATPAARSRTQAPGVQTPGTQTPQPGSQPVSPSRSQPGSPSQAPPGTEGPRAAQHRRGAALSETAAMPVVDESVGAPHAADADAPAAGPRTDSRTDSRTGSRTGREVSSSPSTGRSSTAVEGDDDKTNTSTVGLVRPGSGEFAGRAARRRAAQRRGRGGGQQPPARTAGTRLEARRAERARREGPAIIASRFLGEVFISAGVLMLLFVAYQLWWTNVLAGQEAGGAAQSLQDQWKGGGGKGKSGLDPERRADDFAPGEGFAILYLPKLDVRVPIAQGVSKPKVLDKGLVGHYDEQPFKTAMPWDKKGNFALAGHRNTHGEPFRYINRLVAGDDIVVETATKFYTYKMANRLPSTSPSNTSVIEPVPQGSGFRKPGRYVTLTTCTPEFTSKYRLIVWGKMVEERPRSKGKPDALVE
jgi:LPXTG-site transpeptidase (sortase) family protein